MDEVYLFKQRQKLLSSGKKILFFHIPKTAGSSIIAAFDRYYTREPVWYGTSGLSSEDHYEFVHKHIMRRELDSINNKNFTKFIFLRDPKKRIISAYNYSLYKTMVDIRGGRLKESEVRVVDFLTFLKSVPRGVFTYEDSKPFLDMVHNKYYKKMYLDTSPMKLSAFDYRDGVVLDSKKRDLLEARNLSSAAHLDNAYLNWLLPDPKIGKKIERHDIEEALEYLGKFDFVGIHENYDEDIKELYKTYSIPDPALHPRLNSIKALTKEGNVMDGVSLFHGPITPEIDKELNRLTKYDYVIYNAAKEIVRERRRKGVK